MFEKFRTNPKKTWNIINDLRGKSKSLPKSSFVIGSERINNRRIIATKFNEYFVSLASKLNESLYDQGSVQIQDIPQFNQYLSNKVDISLFRIGTSRYY